MITVMEIMVRVLDKLIDIKDGIVDWFQYIGEEIRNEECDTAVMDTQQLRRIEVSANLRKPYNTHTRGKRHNMSSRHAT